MASGVTLMFNGSADTPLANASQIEVVEKWGEPIRFHLHYSADIVGGDLPLLVDQDLDPGSEVSIFVTGNSGTQCLVKGPIHAHDVQLQSGGAGSGLTVHGADNSIKLARIDRSAIWPDGSDTGAVRSIFNANGMMNVEADETDSNYSEDKHTLVQRSSDFDFVHMLARRNGYLIWITYDDDATEIVHFKKPPLSDVAEHELIINLDEANLDQLKISWDVERPDSVTGLQLDLNSLETIDAATDDSGLELLGAQSMADIRGEPYSTHLAVASDDLADMHARAQGLLTESNWFIKGLCATSTNRLGAVVRSHTVVNLRGAGSRYSGHYFVSGVSHMIDSTSHIMNINLVRNAW